MKFLDSVSKRPEAEAVGQQNMCFFLGTSHFVHGVVNICQY